MKKGVGRPTLLLQASKLQQHHTQRGSQPGVGAGLEMIDGQKINLWVLHVLCSPTNYARVRGAYSTKFYLARLRSKVQSAVQCENAK